MYRIGVADDPEIQTWISVDPGSVHNGWARWIHSPAGWKCTEAIELTKIECEDRLLNIARSVTGIAIEGFFLSPDKSLQQIGSSFGEVEVIGIARASARRNGLKFRVVTNQNRSAARVRMRKNGYSFVARGNGTHAHDAEATLVAALQISLADLVDHRKPL